MTKVLLSWLWLSASRAGVWLLARLMWVPMQALDALCEWQDDAEIAWLLANTSRRLDARRRVELLGEIEPLAGSSPCPLDGRGRHELW